MRVLERSADGRGVYLMFLLAEMRAASIHAWKLTAHGASKVWLTAFSRSASLTDSILFTGVRSHCAACFRSLTSLSNASFQPPPTPSFI